MYLAHDAVAAAAAARLEADWLVKGTAGTLVGGGEGGAPEGGVWYE